MTRVQLSCREEQQRLKCNSRHNNLVVCLPHMCLSYLQEAQQQQQPPLPQLAQLARHTAHLGYQAHKLQGLMSAGQMSPLHTEPSSRPGLCLLERDQAAMQVQTLQTARVRGSVLGDWCAACLRLSGQMREPKALQSGRHRCHQVARSSLNPCASQIQHGHQCCAELQVQRQPLCTCFQLGQNQRTQAKAPLI